MFIWFVRRLALALPGSERPRGVKGIGSVHVTTIVTQHGSHWRHFPVLARQGADWVMFVDHRNTPQERQDALYAVLDFRDINSVEVVSLTEPGGCERDEHQWQTIMEAGDVATRVRCAWCDLVVTLDAPFPADVARIGPNLSAVR